MMERSKLLVVTDPGSNGLTIDPKMTHYIPIPIDPNWGESEVDWGQNATGENRTILNISDEIQFSLTFQVCIYIMYNVVFVGAVGGNLLVVYVVGWSRRMRTVTNYLIGNLAVGDLLMALLCVPFSYISVLLQYWPFGRFLCHLVSPAQAVCVFVSAYTLVALAIDRYLAILYPLRPRLRRSQALIVIALVWMVALLTAAPIALFTRLKVDPDRGLPLCEESGWESEEMKLAYSLTLMILQYFFPISVLIFTYTRIALAVWGKKAPGEAEDARDQRLAKAKRKTVVMTLCVVVGYTSAWLPLNLFQLYLETLTFAPQATPTGDLNTTTTPTNFDPSDGGLPPYIGYIFFGCHWLAMAHSMYNPIIYAWINSKFRSAFSAVFNKCWRSRVKERGRGGKFASGSRGGRRGRSSRSRATSATAGGADYLINNKDGALVILHRHPASGHLIPASTNPKDNLL